MRVQAASAMMCYKNQENEQILKNHKVAVELYPLLSLIERIST